MRRALTEEELALLGHSELVPEERYVLERYEEHGDPVLAGFRERLILGDISW